MFLMALGPKLALRGLRVAFLSLLVALLWLLSTLWLVWATPGSVLVVWILGSPPPKEFLNGSFLVAPLVLMFLLPEGRV